MFWGFSNITGSVEHGRAHKQRRCEDCGCLIPARKRICGPCRADRFDARVRKRSAELKAKRGQG